MYRGWDRMDAARRDDIRAGGDAILARLDAGARV